MLLALVGVAAIWAQDITIGSAAEWEAFATAVNNGTSYSGRTVRLTADIGTAQEPITATVGTVSGGTQGNAFAGRFIGGGHTIHVSITNTSDQGTAPFRYISGATIEGLKVTGSVEGNLHCAGLVGFAASGTTCAIKNCEVAVSVTCSGGDHSHCGGILGHGLSSVTTISNCLFSGSITGTTTATGIIYGWGDGGTHRIWNCLSTGDYTDCEGVDLLKKCGGAEGISNCYRKTSSGSQGTDASGMTADELAAALNNGSLEWQVDGGIVVPIMLKDPYIQFATITSVNSYYLYNGSAISITPVVKDINGTELTLGTDFTATLNGNSVASFPFTVNDLANYTLTITGTGSYIGSQTARFTVMDYSKSLYIDADGNTAQCTDYTVVSSNYSFGEDNGVATLGVEDNKERWYVVADTINLDKPLRVEGNAHIILSDDALLNINADTTDVAAFYGSGSSLVIYGQAQGTGTLYVYNRGITISVEDGNDMTINGGTINAIGSDETFNPGFYIFEGGMLTINRGTVNARGTYCGILVQKACLAINGGTVSATCNGGDLSAAIGVIENSTATINGGNVTATGIDIGWGAAAGISVNTNSILTFGLTNDSDRITASSYYVGNNSSLRIANGKPLYNGIEDLEPGVVSDLTKLNGKTLTPFIPENVVLTASHTTWENCKKYVLNSDVTINERIMVNGAVCLVLGEGCTLHAPKGIELTAGNKLTIDGPGTLNIDGCDTNKSGIGAYSVGVLVINGGTLNATGGRYGAGLGGDIHNIGGGSITINGGVVNATGGEGAAGIGGGYDNWAGNYGVCGTIAINGGQVTATGGATAYGIGVGYNADGDEEKSGSVVLGWSKPTDFIYATGGPGSYSPRIQSLSFAEGRSFILDGTETVATLSNIEGKKIVPSKYGKRYDMNGDDKPTLADLTLLVNVMSQEDVYKSLTPTSSGDVVLTSSHTTWENGKTYLLNSDVYIGERITVNGTVRLVLGTGCTLNAPKGIELSAGKRLTIDGRGTLNIYSCDYYKSGIGAYEVGTLIINGGTINVTGGTRGAGLGGDQNNTSGGVITINGGMVNATGGRMGSAIGSGEKNWDGAYGVCGVITINGGQVTATGGWNASAIGHGSHNAFDLEKSGSLVLGWTLGTDFVHTISDATLNSGISAHFENFSFAEGKTFLVDGTDVEANSSVEFYTWSVNIGNQKNPKLVPQFSQTGLRGDMNGDGKLTFVDFPVLLDSVMAVAGAPVPPLFITLSPSKLTLDPTGVDNPYSLQVSALFHPDNASCKKLIWTSSNPNVASVDEHGVVYADFEDGESIITATTEDSGVSASCKVTVRVGAVENPPLISSITLSPTECTIDPSGFDAPQSIQIRASILPRTANRQLIWTSSEPDWVSVDGNGNVRVEYYEVGECYITATAADGSGVSATCKVNVTIGEWDWGLID